MIKMEVQLVSLCKNLLQGRYPRDDTLFEKLISAMDKKENVWDKLAKCKEFIDILVKCSDEVSTIDPMCLSGLLRLFGVIFEKNIDIFKTQSPNAANDVNMMVVILLNCLNCSYVQENKSVANAVLFCMKKMYSSNDRFVAFYRDEFWAFMKRCLQDGSLFVINAAVSLFADLIVLCYIEAKKNGDQFKVFNLEEEQENIDSVNTAEGNFLKNFNHIKVLKSFIFYLYSSNPKDINLVLQVLNEILDNETNVKELEDFVNEYNIPETIQKGMTHLESSGLKCDLEIFIKLMKLNCIEDIPRKLFSWLYRLMKEENYGSALKLCSCLLQMPKNSDERFSFEEKIVGYINEILWNDRYNTNTKVLFHCFSLFQFLKMHNAYAVQTLCDHILNLKENRKVVKLCISTLSCVIKENKLINLYRPMKVCCMLVETDTDVQIISKCFFCILLIIQQFGDDKLGGEFLECLNNLGGALPEKVMNIKWEIRDSAIEFLGNLALNVECKYIADWLGNHNFSSSIWNNIDDGESYVRASALIALRKWLHNPILRKQILNKYAEGVIVPKIIDILTNDTEAFARRASVDLISDLLSLDDFKPSESTLMAGIQISIKDLDWEVKMRTLSFWENFLKDYISTTQTEENESNCIEQNKQFCTLIKTGFFENLFTASDDFDEVVQNKAIVILSEYKAELVKLGINFTTFLEAPTSDLNCEEHVKINNILHRILKDTKDNARSENDYDENICSLLSDILVSLETSSRKENYEDDNINASMLDCY